MGERVTSRRDQGVLAECWGAQLLFSGALLGVFGWWNYADWDLSLFLPLSLIFSLSLLFIDRERSQHCPVLEWLQVQPDVSLAFSSFCDVIPQLYSSFHLQLVVSFVPVFYLPHFFCPFPSSVPIPFIFICLTEPLYLLLQIFLLVL